MARRPAGISRANWRKANRAARVSNGTAGSNDASVNVAPVSVPRPNMPPPPKIRVTRQSTDTGSRVRTAIQNLINLRMALLPQILERYRPLIERTMRDNARWYDRSGEARRGLTAVVEQLVFTRNSGVRGRINMGHTKQYGSYLELGTKAHEIRPRPGKRWLYWPERGPWSAAGHPRRRVWHPGVTPGKYTVVQPVAAKFAVLIRRSLINAWTAG